MLFGQDDCRDDTCVGVTAWGCNGSRPASACPEPIDNRFVIRAQLPRHSSTENRSEKH